MAKTLTLQISDKTYKLLATTASQHGQTPEQIVSDWIEDRVKQTVEDPLLRLAGAFEAKVTDVSERHDEYFGQSLSTGYE
jgi:hypothetical protein